MTDRTPVTSAAEIRQLNDLLAIGLERYLKQFIRERKRNGHRPNSINCFDDRGRSDRRRVGVEMKEPNHV